MHQYLVPDTRYSPVAPAFVLGYRIIEARHVSYLELWWSKPPTRMQGGSILETARQKEGRDCALRRDLMAMSNFRCKLFLFFWGGMTNVALSYCELSNAPPDQGCAT